MARVTVEDCLKKVENRFDLVLVSVRRTRELDNQSQNKMVLMDPDTQVNQKNYKNTVISLYEIAAGLVKYD